MVSNEEEMDVSDYETYEKTDMRVQKLARLYVLYGTTIEQINKSGFQYMHAIIKEILRLNSKEKNPLGLTTKNSNVDSKWLWELHKDVPVSTKSYTKVTIWSSFDDPNGADIACKPLIYLKTTYVNEQVSKNFFGSVQKKMAKAGYNLVKYTETEYVFECDTDFEKEDIATIASKLFSGFKVAMKIVEENKHLLVDE